MSSQSMSGKTNYNTDPNHIYYNLQLFNNDTVGTSNSLPVRFQETRTSIILANPSEYFLSIQRFHIDTPSLPVFMPEVETSPQFNDTQNPNQLIYQIIIYQQNSTANPYIIPIIFNPSLHPTVLPPPKLDVNALSNPYYFVAEFQDFIDMINQSIQNYWLKETVTVPFPIFGMSTTGNRFKLYFPSSSTPEPPTPSYAPIYNDNPFPEFSEVPPTTWVMCFNSPLHTLFSSFRYRYIDSMNNAPGYLGPIFTSPKQTNGWYVVSNRPALSGSTTLNVTSSVGAFPLQGSNLLGVDQLLATDAIPSYPFKAGLPYTSSSSIPVNSFEVLEQPYSSAPLWSCVKQLIFTTALMPVNNELVGLPGIINSNTALDTDVQNNNFSPVITDLEVPLVTGDEIKPSISYSPNGEYRLIDLLSNTPINSIEISVFWKDQYGVLHPFVLEPGCFSSLKILFRRKIFNLIYLPEYTKSIN
jgi:hypothetical protein